MYLLLGEPTDPLCSAVLPLLESSGYTVGILGNPMPRPVRFTWRFDTFSSASHLTWEDGVHLPDREIDGVLVRRPSLVSSDGWDPVDLTYIRAETQAALLAWLWSLDCPVVNRYPASLWHCLEMPLLFWRLWLERCGLSVLPALISTVPEEARAFGTALGKQSIYAPLTTAVRYQLDCDDHWKKLEAMQRLGPVHLTRASAPLRAACIVGSRVVWDSTAPPTDADVLEQAFLRFSTVAQLAIVEIMITSTPDGVRVAGVNPSPCLEHFGKVARNQIVSGLVELLTGSRHPKSNLDPHQP